MVDLGGQAQSVTLGVAGIAGDGGYLWFAVL